MESMMTVREVAELLGVHENWSTIKPSPGSCRATRSAARAASTPTRCVAGSPITASPSADGSHVSASPRSARRPVATDALLKMESTSRLPRRRRDSTPTTRSHGYSTDRGGRG